MEISNEVYSIFIKIYWILCFVLIVIQTLLAGKRKRTDNNRKKISSFKKEDISFKDLIMIDDRERK